MTVRGINKLKRQVGNLRRTLEDEVADGVEVGAEQVEDEAKRNIVEHNTVWRGNLYRSMDVRRRPTTLGTQIRVVADADYAKYVEWGTGFRRDPRAKPPFVFSSPSEAEWDEVFGGIFRWVKNKPLFERERTAETAARITNTIVTKGTYPHPFMRPAWFVGKPVVVANAKRGVKRAVRRA